MNLKKRSVARMQAFGDLLWSLFGGTKKVYPKFVYPPVEYSLYAFNKVQNPAIPLTTKIPAQIPWLSTHLQHSPDRSILTHPAFKPAYEQRKRKSFYNNSVEFQLSPFYLRPLPRQRADFSNGTYLTSRDATPRQYRNSRFYDIMQENQLLARQRGRTRI